MAALVAFAAQAQDRADRQELTDPDSFTMILLGDPQGYTKYDINQPLFDLCTAWIADNVDHLNIKAVLCTGDLVEQNENIVLNRKMLNQTSREMWEAASHALARLDGKVPYIVSPGNHDYGYRKAENSRTCFPDYFPFERNPAWRDVCVATYRASCCPDSCKSDRNPSVRGRPTKRNSRPRRSRRTCGDGSSDRPYRRPSSSKAFRD